MACKVVEVPRTAVEWVAGKAPACIAVRVAKEAVVVLLVVLPVPPPVEPSGGLLGFLVGYQVGMLVNRRDKSRETSRRIRCRSSDTS